MILIALMLFAILGPGLAGVLIAIAIAYLAQFTLLINTRIMSLKR